VVAGSAVITKGCYWGLGRHIYYLSPEQIPNAFKYGVIIMTAPLLVGGALGRISFCLFLLSTLGTVLSTRVALWITIVLQILVNGSANILLYSSCGTQVVALWDQTVQADCIPYQRRINYLYFLSGLHAHLRGNANINSVEYAYRFISCHLSCDSAERSADRV
jgi:hypothetical protein